MMDRVFLFLIIIAFATSCARHSEQVSDQSQSLLVLHAKTKDQTLASINIIDRNGLTETISSKERLKGFETTDFLSSQPYQKVLRVFAKDKTGKSLSIITSYYQTGGLKQYLEVINGRATGAYIEWHPNGRKKLQATVLGGSPDIDEKSQVGWSFDGKSYSWNEDGALIADIPYDRGSLDGLARYYHANGALSETIPYHKNEMNGTVEVFDSGGHLLEKTTYVKDLKEGESLGFWPSSQSAWKEVWNKNRLLDGVYFDKSAKEICHVHNGTGQRVLFSEQGISEIQEYKQGEPEGEVILYDDESRIIRRLRVKNNQKHGEEVYYWPKPGSQLIPKLSIEWYQGRMQGLVKTFYEDGSQESQREMSNNYKQGVLMAWYRDGQLMLIEEYEKDRLRRGDYLKKGNTMPVSKIIDGNGTATFYDADGTFVRRVAYKDGKPVDDETSHAL